MALNFETAFGASNKASGTAAQERPKTQVWLNIGYEANGKFVNLPVGIPLDTTEPVQANGQNEEWVKFQTARNQFLDFLQKHGAKMEPGAEEEIKGLTIKIKRVAGPMSIDNAENEFASDMSFVKIGA